MTLKDRSLIVPCARHLVSIVHLSFNVELLIPTSPGNVKLHSDRDSSDWHMQSHGKALVFTESLICFCLAFKLVPAFQLLHSHAHLIVRWQNRD